MVTGGDEESAGHGPPVASGADHIHTLAKATISAIPWVGGPGAELFSAIVPASLERRRDAFFRLLDERLKSLEDREVDLGALFADEFFVTMVIEASKQALGTHLDEKVRLLVGCLESAALPDRPDDFLAMRMLQWVGELDPEHFLVLLYCTSPAAWYERKKIAQNPMMGARQAILEQAQLPITGDARALCIKDLGDRRLIEPGMLGGMVSAESIWDPVSTALGSEFLAFVRFMAPDQG